MTTNTPIMRATALLAFALLAITPARAGDLPATGQTTSYEAIMDYGGSPVPVPDDGVLQRGAPLRYKLLADGTVKDLNTDLIWEVKCADCGGLHEVANVYPWSGDGVTDTIWDWLADINAEDGTGYAGHKDWRIPNARELQSIVDYDSSGPGLNPIFGPLSPFPTPYWTSTTYLPSPSKAWSVTFSSGSVWDDPKYANMVVRAVRGGSTRIRIPKVPLVD